MADKAGTSTALCGTSSHSCPAVLTSRTDELLRLLDMAKPDNGEDDGFSYDELGTTSLHRRAFEKSPTMKLANSTIKQRKQASKLNPQSHGGCRRRRVYQYLTENSEPSTSQTNNISEETVATTTSSTKQREIRYYDINIPEQKFMASPSSTTSHGKSLKRSPSAFARRQLPRIDSARALGDAELQLSRAVAA